MKCPKCQKSELRVTHTYLAGSSGKTQRLVCPSCNVVCTGVITIAYVDPGRGDGAATLARRLAQEKEGS